MPKKVHTAPVGSGHAVRGKTLPQLLHEAAATYENLSALNQPHETGWKPYSLEDFKRHSEEMALGLLEMGLSRGDRAVLFMESDVYFCIADMGCLIAGIIDVPIYLTHTPEQIGYVIRHSESTTAIVSDASTLEAMKEVLEDDSGIERVIVANASDVDDLPQLPEGIRLYTLANVRDLGRRRLRAEPDALRDLLNAVSPDDLATIIYTSGTTGKPKGVMLSHENISFNALTSFSGLPDYEPGPDGERTISFLPLTHIFARTLHYGFLYNGTSVYFTTPEHLSADLKSVRPTIFASVPRVLEKVYGKILERITQMSGPQRWIANWALRVGERYELGRAPAGAYRLSLSIADRLVFKKWREALGGRVKYVISGGAALSERLTNLFAAAGVIVLQGYGLTETSPVIAFSRPGRNRAGTVGEPIPEVEVAIGEDGEILTRGPHIMMGYYKDEDRTDQAIDDDGWFHTGDIGEFTDEGFLRITDRKKDLFKLSTGKYVMPQPLENGLTTHPLVEQAVVVGSGYKFCTALIFPDQEKVTVYARSKGLNTQGSIDDLLADPLIQDRFKDLVEEANRTMDPWSRIKRFRLIAEHLTPESGLLTPTMKIKRSRVQEDFADEIEEMYSDNGSDNGQFVVVERAEVHEHA